MSKFRKETKLVLKASKSTQQETTKELSSSFSTLSKPEISVSNSNSLTQQNLEVSSSYKQSKVQNEELNSNVSPSLDNQNNNDVFAFSPASSPPKILDNTTAVSFVYNQKTTFSPERTVGNNQNEFGKMESSQARLIPGSSELMFSFAGGAKESTDDEIEKKEFKKILERNQNSLIKARENSKNLRGLLDKFRNFQIKTA